MIPPVLVISTGAGCPEGAVRCARSVAAEGARHRFAAVDHATFQAAGSEIGPHGYVMRSDLPKIQNLRLLTRETNPEMIVIWLDGDDELTPGAVDRVVRAYTDPEVWLTYGSFVRSDGVRDFAWHAPFGRRYDPRFGPRRGPWAASHLRTFRLGLFERIPRRYLERSPGKYFTTCDDRAIMIPMLEMAGERYAAISDVLCRYSTQHDHSMNALERAQESADRMQIHGMDPLPRLESRPW